MACMVPGCLRITDPDFPKMHVHIVPVSNLYCIQVVLHASSKHHQLLLMGLLRQLLQPIVLVVLKRGPDPFDVRSDLSFQKPIQNDCSFRSTDRLKSEVAITTLMAFPEGLPPKRWCKTW